MTMTSRHERLANHLFAQELRNEATALANTIRLDNGGKLSDEKRRAIIETARPGVGHLALTLAASPNFEQSPGPCATKDVVRYPAPAAGEGLSDVEGAMRILATFFGVPVRTGLPAENGTELFVVQPVPNLREILAPSAQQPQII